MSKSNMTLRNKSNSRVREGEEGGRILGQEPDGDAVLSPRCAKAAAIREVEAVLALMRARAFHPLTASTASHIPLARRAGICDRPDQVRRNCLASVRALTLILAVAAASRTLASLATVTPATVTPATVAPTTPAATPAGAPSGAPPTRSPARAHSCRRN